MVKAELPQTVALLTHKMRQNLLVVIVESTVVVNTFACAPVSVATVSVAVFGPQRWCCEARRTKSTEAVKSPPLFSPKLQRALQCIQHRARVLKSWAGASSQREEAHSGG